MTDMADITDVARRGWPAWLMLPAIGANLFAVVTVNYWIYHARVAFIAAHPDYVAVQPPTISRAISDPLIGEPFAFWVTLSAVMLVFGVAAIAAAFARVARGVRATAPAVARALLGLALGVVALQGVASAGMYYLSHYRFPDHNATHMMGSYLFFIAQCLVIVTGVLICILALRSRALASHMAEAGHGGRRWQACRAGVGCLTVALTLAYMALFQAKGMDFGTANATVYDAYVATEPLVISAFLLFLALFQTDLWAAARRGRRG